MILQQLREQTRENHQRLETRLDLLQSVLSLEQYRLLLSRFYGFYLPVETRLALLFRQQNDPLEFSRRQKIPLLVQDLQVLGLSLPQIHQLPQCQTLPDLSRLPQAWGCCYVMEGATLGGQIISCHLDTHHGIGAETGAAFFHSYGAEVGTLWRAFGAALTAYADACHEEPLIIQAACDTFATLEAWLCND